MKYEVIYKKSAEKELGKLPKRIALQIAEEIDKLGDNPRPHGYKKLTNYQVPHAPKDLYRIRVGDYRAVYSIEDNVITVVVFQIAHRRDIYE